MSEININASEHTSTSTEMQITKDVKVAEKFGNIEKYEAYRKIRDFVVKNKVLRLYQKKTHENGDIEIVICNLFKLVKALRVI